MLGLVLPVLGVAVSNPNAAMEPPEGPSILPGVNTVRVAIVGGPVIAAFAALAPEILIGLAVAYPAALGFAATTGGSVYGRRTRRWLMVAAFTAAAGICGTWLQSHGPAIASIGWAATAGMVAAYLLARALAETHHPSSPSP